MKNTRCLSRQFLGVRGRRPARRSFTLVEVVMGMMVSGMILAAVATLAWTIGTYNGQGEAIADLSRQGVFGMGFLERDLRAARVAGVIDGGRALLLWMGDLRDNGAVDMEEVVIYEYDAIGRTAKRLTFTGGTAIIQLDPTGFDSLIQAYDSGLFTDMASMLGFSIFDEVVCNRVDSLAFYPKRTFPDTASVEFALELSRPEDIISGSGETVYLTLYGMGTLRAPYSEDGFCSQF